MRIQLNTEEQAAISEWIDAHKEDLHRYAKYLEFNAQLCPYDEAQELMFYRMCLEVRKQGTSYLERDTALILYELHQDIHNEIMKRKFWEQGRGYNGEMRTYISLEAPKDPDSEEFLQERISYFQHHRQYMPEPRVEGIIALDEVLDSCDCELDKSILILLGAGYTYAEIQERLNTTKNDIYKVRTAARKRFNKATNPNKKKLTTVDKERIINLYNYGYNRADIIRDIWRSNGIYSERYHAVNSVLRERGIEPESRDVGKFKCIYK